MNRLLSNDNYYIQENVSYACTSWAPVAGFAGIAAAVVFASKFGWLHDDDERANNQRSSLTLFALYCFC